MDHNEIEIEVDLLALLNHLRKKMWIIIAVAAISAVLGFVASKLFITPLYTASTRMYVLNRTNENTVVSADFQISNYMVNDYKELIKGRNVTSEVIAQLGLQMTDGALAGKITVSSPNNTRVLHIDVKDSDPVRAQQIANTVREVTSEQLKKIMHVDAVTTIYDAVVPQSPSSPNVVKNAMITGFLGFVLTLGIYGVVFIVDDRIRSEEDVVRYLGLNIMGVIPDSEKLPEKGKAMPKKKKKVSAQKQVKR